MQLLQCSIFHNLLRNFAALQVLLDILLLTWGASEDYEIVVKTLNSGYSLWINFLFVLFRSGQFHNVVSTFTNVVKLDVENDNVVSTLPNIAHVNFEVHNVDSTLLDIVHFNVEIPNVVSTLVWRCPISRCRINQKTTLKQRWNVCWNVAKPDRLTLSKMQTSNLSLSKSANVTTSSGQSTWVIWI